jgi:hypothetical protein
VRTATYSAPTSPLAMYMMRGEPVAFCNASALLFAPSTSDSFFCDARSHNGSKPRPQRATELRASASGPNPKRPTRRKQVDGGGVTDGPTVSLGPKAPAPGDWTRINSARMQAMGKRRLSLSSSQYFFLVTRELDFVCALNTCFRD